MRLPLDELIAHGFDPDAASSRVALLERADGGFVAMRGTAPTWRWIVPGRLEVFGKHTDYVGGRSLIAAVPRGFAVVAAARPDSIVRVLDARHGEVTSVDLAGVARPRRGWTTYVSAVVQRLAANFPSAPLGADVVFASDLPRAAGVSSSSALLVGIASALIRRAGLSAREEWRRAIASPLDLAEYFGCIENGRTFRSLSGARGVGTQGGSEDHTAILLARSGTLRQFSYTPVSHEADVPMPADWRFVIASSGVHADKAGAVRDRYNRISRAAALLLTIWNQCAGTTAVSLGAAFATNPSGPDLLSRRLRETSTDEFTATELEQRLAHFLREDARVPAAVEAFRTANLVGLGALAAASQQDAAELLHNQVPETVALVEEALAAGAPAASSFGAGFGGSVWAVVPADEADRFAAQWMTQYRARFPHLTRVECFSALPAPPLCEVVG